MTDEILFDADRRANPHDSIHADDVFDHWVATCRPSGKGPRPVLTDKRRKIIVRALRDYGVQTLFEAIVGITKSEWHMGSNPGGKRYDSIELILRDAEKIERFATLGTARTAAEEFAQQASTPGMWVIS